MPNVKSAAKRVKITQKRTLRNARLKSSLRTTIRRFNEAISGATSEEAKGALHKALVAIDKAVTKGILHKNAAARKKSRLTRRFNKAAS